MDEPKDLLRRVFIPIEHVTSTGSIVFRTMDREAYRRDPTTGAISRIHPKIDKKQRRKNANARRNARRP